MGLGMGFPSRSKSHFPSWIDDVDSYARLGERVSFGAPCPLFTSMYCPVRLIRAHSAIMYLRGGRAKFWGEEERVAFSSSSKNGRNGRLDCARLLSPSHSPSVLVIEAGLTPSRFSPLREMPRMLSVFRFCVPALQPPSSSSTQVLKAPLPNTEEESGWRTPYQKS